MANRARPVDDDVWRIRLDSPCGLVVNAYAARTRDGYVLIDSGFPHTSAQLREGLRELGATLADVHDVLYTHTHVDHIGGGVALSESWSPREWIWEGAEPAFGDVAGFLRAQRTPASWPDGIVAATEREHPRVLEMKRKPRLPIEGGPTGALADPRGVPHGGRVTCGGRVFECIDGRGHDPYHCGWLCVASGALFSGDVVLRSPVPLSWRAGDDPARWRQTLAAWGDDARIARLMPGHGLPTRLVGPSLERSDASLSRVEAAVDASLANGRSASALEVVERLLPVDPTEFAARSSVLLATVDTVLELSRSRDGSRRSDDGVWRRCATD